MRRVHKLSLNAFFASKVVGSGDLGSFISWDLPARLTAKSFVEEGAYVFIAGRVLVWLTK